MRLVIFSISSRTCPICREDIQINRILLVRAQPGDRGIQRRIPNPQLADPNAYVPPDAGLVALRSPRRHRSVQILNYDQRICVICYRTFITNDGIDLCNTCVRNIP